MKVAPNGAIFLVPCFCPLLGIGCFLLLAASGFDRRARLRRISDIEFCKVELSLRVGFLSVPSSVSLFRRPGAFHRLWSAGRL